MKRESLITKLVAFMLCVMMVVGCLPVSAFAANDWEGEIDGYEYPVGSQENPATVEWVWNEAYTEATATVTVPANSTMYFQDRSLSAVNVLTANGKTVEVTYGTPRMTPSTWNIPNTTEADVEYTLVLTYAVGSMENPYAASLYENVVSVEAGDKDGYYMTYTAEYTGTLVVTISTEAAGWSYVINNNTAYIYGDTQWSDSDPVVNPAEIAVTEGDEIQIIVNTYDPADSWNSPAGEINAYLEYKPGSCEAFPIFLGEQVNNVTNAGTMYYKGYFAGMNVVITGEGEFTVISDGEEIAAVDGKVEVSYPTVMGRPMPNSIVIVGDGEFTIAASYPLGTMENPAVAVLGDNTASIAAGGSEYVWNYTAEKDGDLVITVSTASGNWQYVVNNMTTYVYGDTQWSDSDPVVNPATITVKAGDVIEIKALTYDPESPWAAPAGDVTVNLAYKPALQEFVKSLSIAPRNNVALRFIIDPDLDDDGVLELEGDDNVAVFYKIDETSGEWTEADRVAQADWESYSNNRFTATYRIAARQMADEIKIVIVNANGDPISVEYTDSARAYGMRAVEKLYPQASSSEKTALQLTMFVDFLNYGAAAQTQFEYNTDDLANNQLTEDHQAYATAEAVAENLRTGHGSSQVSVKDSIELSFLLDQSVVSSDMYVVISYTHFDGTTESITVQGTDFDTYTSKGVTKWKVLTPNIKTPDGNQLITCVVYTADGTEVTRAQDSINSYMARVLAAASAAQSLKNLATAAVKFCASAYNYFTY